MNVVAAEARDYIRNFFPLLLLQEKNATFL
jgi:hypothetical protein